MPLFALILIHTLAAALLGLVLIRICKRVRTLSQSSRRFGATLEHVYEDVYEIDINGDVVYQYCVLNGEAIKTMLAEPPSEYLPRIIREQVFPADREAVGAALSPDSLRSCVGENVQPLRLEYRRITPKGTPKWYSMIVKGLCAQGRNPAVAMVYIADIDDTRRKVEQSNRNIMKALQNAEHLSEVKTNFTSRISHEIRTPLNAMVGYLAIARRDIEDRGKVEDCLEKAGIATQHLMSIVNDMLDVSALESGKMKLDYRPFKLRELIGDIGFMYYSQAKEARISLTIDMRDVTEASLIGDDLRLRQILMNLLSNALKFTPAGGRVELSIRQDALNDELAHFSFVVRDTGIGIKPEFMPHLFGTYEQADETTAREYGGSGLGLSIVKHLVENMNGSVKVESAPGEGSVFTVLLPFQRVCLTLPEGAQRKLISRLRVMLISGDQQTLRFVSEQARRLDITLESAVDCTVALEKVEQLHRDGGHIDLLLLDWSLRASAQVQVNGRCIKDVLPEDTMAVALVRENAVEVQMEKDRYRLFDAVQLPLSPSVLLDLFCDAANHHSVTHKDEKHNVDLSGSRILLVEDNRMNREIAKELLRGLHLSVDEAVNGKESVEMYMAQPAYYYQLVLMDAQMPVMDGFAATKAIREAGREDSASIPIIALTANAYASDVNRSLASGMNAHVSKPIEPELLIGVLQTFLNHAK